MTRFAECNVPDQWQWHDGAQVHESHYHQQQVRSISPATTELVSELLRSTICYGDSTCPNAVDAIAPAV
jgi:hypothetical protein